MKNPGEGYHPQGRAEEAAKVEERLESIHGVAAANPN